MRSACPGLQHGRASRIPPRSLDEDKRHVDVQRLFCTISLGRHIGLAARPSCDARRDRLPRRQDRVDGQTVASGNDTDMSWRYAFSTGFEWQDVSPKATPCYGSQWPQTLIALPIKGINCYFGGQHGEPTTCSRKTEKKTSRCRATPVAMRLSVSV